MFYIKRLNRAVQLTSMLCLAVATSAFGLTQRVENSTIAMPQEVGDVEVFAYTTEDAFSGLNFADIIAIVSPPGETNRLFAVAKFGAIYVVTNLANPSVDTFMDIQTRVDDSQNEEGLLGMAFHPDYASNGYFYLFFTADDTTSQASNDRHDVLSRFETSPTNSNMGVATSEVVIIRQYDDWWNHNGGDLHFGPDGYLYVALGDEGASNDSRDNSQRIDKDFFSAIARIDVDLLPGSLAPNPHPANNGATTNYAIPADNPFIGFTQFNGVAVNSNEVWTEFYAVGLRNPWRFSFDEVDGQLYCGDVGQNNREEVNLIVKGGNYGWKWREGLISTPTVGGSPPAGFTNWIDPILDYTNGSLASPTEGNAVIGGRVYRGNQLPELLGHYVFGDNGSGNIWALQHNGTTATNWYRLTLLNDYSLTAIGVDPRDGELLLADRGNERILRLVRNTAQSSNALPDTLTDTGVFSDLTALTPHAGIVPYDVNVPLWSDGALKRRWFSIPSTNNFMAFDLEEPWKFPTGTVWVKHFDILLTNGEAASSRRLETRLLVQTTGGVYGATYRWGQSKTNAVLVQAAGQTEQLLIDTGSGTVTQTWVYPSREACLSCHTPEGGGVLGFHTAQLNLEYGYTTSTQNQVQAFQAVNYFSNSVNPMASWRKLASSTDTTYSVAYRALSYLEANCAQCHHPGPANWDARIRIPLTDSMIIDAPANDDLGYTSNRIVAAGVPSNSVILTRINSLDAGIRMPPLSSSVVDTQAVAVITEWIQDLAGYLSFSNWQVAFFGSNTHHQAGEQADPDWDGVVNYMEWMGGTHPAQDTSGWAKIDIVITNGMHLIEYDQLENLAFQVQWTSNLMDGVTWQPLNVPDNFLHYSATGMSRAVADKDTNSALKYYRIEVFGP